MPMVELGEAKFKADLATIVYPMLITYHHVH
jgi:hypothetical protein